MSVSLSHISFEHHHPAFGIAETQPRISWKFFGDAADWEQTAYDVEITRGPDGVPNVFNVNATDSILVPWPDKPLTNAESASVRARAHGKDGQPSTEWSDAYSVETSLLTADDWAGAITIAADRPTEVDGPKQPVLFRKAFNATDNIASARLYITALGLYEAEINGQRVGDHVLAPGYQAYNYRHVFDTYDVTDLIKAGDNAIGVYVGEGWFSGRFGFGRRPRNLYGDTLGLLALLVTTDKDGKKQTIISDATWKANTGPIITSEIYNGEVFNATLRHEGWSSSGFDDSTWLATKITNFSQGKLSPPDGSPIKKHEEIKPVNIFQSTSGKTVIDFGQNLVGWLRLTVDGPAGTNITMVHTEVMENGEVATRPLRSAKAMDTLILDGTGSITWEPKFTYHGFRYVQITGWPAETPLDGNSVTALVVHSDMERTGYFETSNEELNQFHNNVIWSMKGNFLGVPTDCPQRDERLGWTGDAHAFIPTANYLYDAAGFWRGWLKDSWSEQSRGDLMIPPYYIPTDDIEDTDRGRVRQPTAVWGDVVIGNPWALYLTTGDKDMLKEQLPGAKAWIDKGIPRNDKGLWNRDTFQFGDWLDPKAPAEDAGAATTHKILVADAYLIQMTKLLSQMNEALGDADQQEIYRVQHDDVLIPAFQESWITPYADAGGIANVTQTALALSLRFGVYTAPESQTAAANTLRKIIEDNDFQVGTGFAGTQQLGFALTETNSTSHFYKMLMKTTVPSWLYSVTMNATTTWERWDSMLPDGSVNPGSMTSFNHYAFGSVADWMHQKIGGLAPGEPGWKTVNVAPEPGGGITNAKSSYLSAYGWVNVTWEVTDGFHMEVNVPPNAKAQVTLPGSGEVKEVGSGKSTFDVADFVMPE